MRIDWPPSTAITGLAIAAIVSLLLWVVIALVLLGGTSIW